MSSLTVLGSIAAISVGASLGAVSRWLLGMGLNSLFPSIPPGTLAANLGGSYLIGLAVALFATHPGIAPAWRLLVVTGFLGALTTFSTFSAEVVTLIQEGRWLLAAGAVSIHVGGALLMTLLGLATIAAFHRA